MCCLINSHQIDSSHTYLYATGRTMLSIFPFTLLWHDLFEFNWSVSQILLLLFKSMYKYQFRVICAFFHMCLEYDVCFFVRKQFYHEGIGIPAHHLVVKIIMIWPNLFYYNNQVVCWIFCTNWLYSSSQTTLLCSHYSSCFEFSECYNSACH